MRLKAVVGGKKGPKCAFCPAGETTAAAGCGRKGEKHLVWHCGCGWNRCTVEKFSWRGSVDGPDEEPVKVGRGGFFKKEIGEIKRGDYIP